MEAILNAEAPLWLTLTVVFTLGWLGWTTKKLNDRLNAHAEAISACDEWADVVDGELSQLERPRQPPKISTTVRGSDRPRGY